MFNINKAEKIVAIKRISFGEDLYLKSDKVIKIILVTQKGLVTPESLSLVAMPGVTSCPSPRRTPLPRIPLGAPGLEPALLCY